MGRVEGLGVTGLVVDHTHCSDMVHNVTLLCVVQVLPTVVTTVTAQL